MARSSIPGVVEYLIAETKAASDKNVVIVDGFPNSLNYTRAIVFGGVDEDLTTGDVEPAQISRGRSKRRENYSVIGECIVGVGGTDQALSRRIAFDLYAVVEDVVYKDMSLGGRVRLAMIDTLTVSSSSAEDATQGRITRLRFTITVQNDYIPGGD